MDQIAKTVYVVRYRAEGEWTVQREGNKRPNVVLPTQRRAESAAVKLAKSHAPASVVIHDRDGSLAKQLSIAPVTAKGAG